MTKRQQRLRLGTRTSRLARWQSARIVSLLTEKWPDLKCEIRAFETKGDKTIDRPLPEIGGKGLFTAELEAALLDGDIDIAVHSLKDLPVQNPAGLAIGAIPKRGDVGDALVARNSDTTLSTLPPGAIVGTSSLRRQAQILAVRPDLRVRSIRGNVETRVRKVRDGLYDAAVLASAGLKRLSLQDEVSAWFSYDVMLPAPGQGALAVQCRGDDRETLELLRAIDDRDTRRATTAERHFLQNLGGGCSAPIAAYARCLDEDKLQMQALIASPSGATMIRVSGSGMNPYELATELAGEALALGAGDILAAVSAAQNSSTSPLEGRRIVITRPREQADTFAAQLRELGAVPIIFPTIRIAPIDDTGPLDAAIRRLTEYDWVIFTSVNGVDIFHERLQALDAGVDQLKRLHVAAIGPATGSALSEAGVMPDFIPDEYVAERIAEGLGDVGGLKILLPRAEQARAALSELLSARGADVEEIATYQTITGEPNTEARKELESAGVITFTSSSTVRNFVSLVGGRQEASRLASRSVIACIGPITAATAGELGMEPQIVAEEYTIDGLIAALLSYFQ